MSYNLFLDDERVPHKVSWIKDDRYGTAEWVIVRNYKEFCRTIAQQGLPKLISFDHDLADEHYKYGSESKFTKFDYDKVNEKTGYDCAKWLVEFCEGTQRPLPEYLLHSMNPIGRENIQSLFESYKKANPYCLVGLEMPIEAAQRLKELKENNDPAFQQFLKDNKIVDIKFK